MFYSSNQPNIHKQFNVPQSTNRPSHNKFVNILLQREIKIDLCGSPCTFHITLNAQVFGSHTKATNHWQSDKSCHSKAITQQEYNYRSNQLTNSVCRLISKLCNLQKNSNCNKFQPQKNILCLEIIKSNLDFSLPI